MTLATFKRKPLITFYALGVVLLLVAGGGWLYKQATDPERIFWGAIEQGMRTNGVTIKATQANQGNGSNIEQTLQYSLGANSRSHALTKLTQGKTVVKNEMIGTPSADFNRYLSITTDQKSADGGDLDFSKLIGVWASGLQPQLFAQATLGTGLPIGGMVVPIGSLTPEQRAKVMKVIRENNVYAIDFSKAKKQSAGGRSQYVYDVKIKPTGYARLMKTFAEGVGLHELDQLDPDAYKGQPDLSLKITVDAKARNVVTVALPENDYKQTYSSYDVPVTVNIPQKPISATELQDRLRNL